MTTEEQEKYFERRETCIGCAALDDDIPDELTIEFFRNLYNTIERET